MVSPPQHATRNPWSPTMNWHVTLGFFGEKPEGSVDAMVEHVRGVARRTSAFDIGLAGAGIFRHDVCWVGVDDPSGSLEPLADRVRQGYAIRDQHSHHRFHLTVSRAGRQAGLADVMAALAVYRGPMWTVDSIGLFRSDLGEGVGGHPLYTALADVPLLGEDD